MNPDPIVQHQGEPVTAESGTDLSRTIETQFRHTATAFDAGTSRDVNWRKEQLEAIEDMLSRHEDEFAAALEQDLGKSAVEALITEISFTINAARHARKNLARWMKDERVATPASLKPGRSFIRHEPLGVVLVIAPWNYPVQLCLVPLITAIAAGNCAMIKPSELAPASSRLIANMVERYLDNDCIRVIEGAVEASTALLRLPFDHIVFTGGERVARIVMEAAARHLVPVTLELGGKSPCMIMPDADMAVTARRIIFGKTVNSGQSCIAPDYLLCDAATREALLPELARALKEMFGDDASQAADYGHIVNRQHFDRIVALMDEDKVVLGGQHNADRLYIEPTILHPVDPDDAVMQEEIFGPLLPIIEVSDLDEAIEFVKARPRPLASYLFTGDRGAQAKWNDQVCAGSVCINDTMVFLAIEELPFSGVGPSGHGNYKGQTGFQRLSHRKAILKRGWWPDLRLRYAPFTESKEKLLRKIF